MRVLGSVAHKRSQDRLLEHNTNIFPSFDSLSLSFDHDEVFEFLRGTPSFQELSEMMRGRMAGLVMAAMIVAVEDDRYRRENR